VWSAALEATGRDVWLAISWEIDPDYAAEFSGHANSWRTSMDIDCYCEKLVKWPAVKRVFGQVQPWIPYAGNDRNTGRPDCDSLNLGNRLQPFGDGLSAVEERTYSSFWSIVGAPIFTGADLTLLDPLHANGGSHDILVHPALTAINQHPTTAAPDNSAINMSAHPLLQTWVADYGNSTAILGLFNLDDAPRTMRWASPVGSGGARRGFAASDVWSGLPYHGVDGKCGVGGTTGEIQLEPHDSLLLRLAYETDNGDGPTAGIPPPP